MTAKWLGNKGNSISFRAPALIVMAVCSALACVASPGDSKEARAALQRGMELLRLERDQEALPALEEASHAFPLDARISNLLGIALTKLKRIPEATTNSFITPWDRCTCRRSAMQRRFHTWNEPSPWWPAMRRSGWA